MINIDTINIKLFKLKKYAENFPINDMPGFTNIMSLDHKYVQISENSLRLLGDTPQKNFIYIDNDKMPCQATEHDGLLLKQELISLKPEIKILNYTHFDEWKIFLGHKKAIIENNEIIGIITNFIDVTNSGIIDLGRFFLSKKTKLNKKQFNFLIQPIKNLHGLTQREQECLFFLIRGDSYAKIAARLNIAITTVQTHIEHIKQKFHVYTKSQIIEKALSLGFMSIVPESLLNSLLGQI